MNSVVGAYLDMDGEQYMISFTVDGSDQGVAFTIEPSELEGKALFPHVLSKNVKFEVNFGERAEGPFFAHPDRLLGYVPCAEVPVEDRVRGPVPPETKEECEVSDATLFIPQITDTNVPSVVRVGNGGEAAL